MGYVNTGIKRSLTFQVIKQVNGVIVTGYPITYNGQQAFTYNGITYPLLSSPAFAIMSDADYNIRLNAFKAYVSTIEPGINFDTDIAVGYEPVKTDLGDCPPPAEVTTTTTTAGVTSTTTTLARRDINISLSYGGESGATNGVQGEISVCGILFNVPVYTTNTNINTTGLASQSCLVDLSALILKINAIQENAFIYYRAVGESNWNDISTSKYIVIPQNGTTTVNLEIFVSNVAKELDCRYFVLTKTDWEDNQRGLFDVVLCDGTQITLEVTDGQPMFVCLHAAIPVNNEDTAEAIMDCTDGDTCHNILLTKTNDDAEIGTFNCVTCDGTDVVLTVLYGEALTICLNSAVPVNQADTAVVLGTCPTVTTTTTTVSSATDIKIAFTSEHQPLSPSVECPGYNNEDFLYTFEVKSGACANINAPVDITIYLEYLQNFVGGSVSGSYTCVIPAGEHSNTILVRTTEVTDGSPGCGCPCQIDTTITDIVINTINPLYNFVIDDCI